MRYFLLEIATSCGVSFVYSDYGPYIYDNLLEAHSDIVDNDEEGVVEVYLQPNGEITTDFHDWEIIQQVLAINNFCEEKYKSYVKSFLISDTS